jgi:hypothetical protein
LGEQENYFFSKTSRSALGPTQFWDATGRLQILSHVYCYSISVQALSLFYLTAVESHFLSAGFNCINIDRRLQSEGKIFPAGKVKGEVHSITGHEGPEVE